MLSEKEIEQLKDGAYGVTRDGCKVLYVDKTSNADYQWLHFCKSNSNKPNCFVDGYDSFNSYWLGKEHSNDIVGLWEERLESFDLKRALDREPVLLENGDKAFVKFQLNTPVIGCHSLVGYRINEQGREDRCSWFDDGDRDDNLKIVGMWKESSPVKPSEEDLPKPIREFGDLEKVWCVAINYKDNIYSPENVAKGQNWTAGESKRAANGCYYATKEDCQKVCDWMMNR